ncbi:hypothetical protein EVA_04308 [gut metagenome]|uniref:Uncharacterized protein n=1 Tax=gut metagenome TaxID=749906 RepID=J9GX25_9ZZZZ
MFNEQQLFLPICCHRGGLNLFRHNGYKCCAFMSRNQMLHFFIAFTLQETFLNQLFNNTGTSGRSAQTFSFGFFRHFICTGSFHCRKQRVLCEMFGRRSFSFFDFCANYIQLISNRNGRENLFFFVRFCRMILLYKGFPTFLQNSFSLSRKHRAVAIQFNNALSISVGISYSHTQTIGNQLQNRKFAFWKFIQIAFLQFLCRNNGMVISNLFVIHNLLPMN